MWEEPDSRRLSFEGRKNKVSTIILWPVANFEGMLSSEVLICGS
jgi:hypothetical protein